VDDDDDDEYIKIYSLKVFNDYSLN